MTTKKIAAQPKPPLTHTPNSLLLERSDRMKRARKHKATFRIRGKKMSLRIMTEWYMRKSSCRYLCTVEHRPHDPTCEQEFFNIYENLLTGEYFAVKVW